MKKTKFIRMPCDICNCKEYTKIGYPEFSNVEKKKVFVPGETLVVRCNGCGYYYTMPMPFWGEDDINKLYSRSYFPEYSSWWKKIREIDNPNRRLNKLESIYPKKIMRFLEVGCGEGLAMKQAMKRKWEVQGQDISPAFAKLVKNNLGIAIFVGQLEEATFPDNYFDIVYLDSVIEHVPRPSILMKSIHRILKPGGLVYIVCPNEDSFINFVKQLMIYLKGNETSVKISPFSEPYHINGFTKRSLKELGRKCSFNVEYISIGKDYEANKSKRYLGRNKDKQKRTISNWLEGVFCYLADKIGKGTNMEAIFSR
ncbi:MAG: methyltransferase domain-containing protein [bacterium]